MSLFILMWPLCCSEPAVAVAEAKVGGGLEIWMQLAMVDQERLACTGRRFHVRRVAPWRERDSDARDID